MKRLLICVLVTVMVFAASVTVLAESKTFTDVAENAWYYTDVANAVELGIINGKTATTFAPNDNLTYAEAIKIAACMYQLDSEGAVSFATGITPWYKVYADYCEVNGIISKKYDYNTPATREGYMEIFANALPDKALEPINYVPDDSIPDVPSSDTYAPAIYKLYRAGILAGVDAEHNCNPDSTIKRSEVAAIITRMMDKAKRVEFSIGEPLSIVNQPHSASVKQGEVLSLHVDVKGGKAPYNYRWEIMQVNNGAETWVNVEKVIYQVKGADSSTLSADTIPAGVARLRCTVTDVRGEAVVTDSIKVDILPEVKDFYFSISTVKNNSIGAQQMIYCTVSGGKAPYTYQWEYRSGRYTYPIEDKNIKGTKTDCIEYTLLPLISINGKQIRMKVTDAEGKVGYSDYVIAPEAMFVMQVESVQSLDGGKLFAGTVKEGALTAGESLALYVKEENVMYYGAVEYIEMFGKKLDVATSGDRCGFFIKDYTWATSESKFVQFLPENIYARANIVSLGGYGIKKPLFGSVSNDRHANLGDEVTFSATVSGGKIPYTYQWTWSDDAMEFTPISESYTYVNTKTQKLTVRVGPTEFTRTYRCTVTDANGESVVTSNAFIEPINALILKQPENAYENSGEKATFAVSAVAPGYDYYQWQVKTPNLNDFVSIKSSDTWATGANTEELTVNVDKTNFYDVCEFRCLVIGSKGSSVVSDTVRIYPEKPVIITQPPKTINANDGATTTVKIDAVGKYTAFTYHWQYYDNNAKAFKDITESLGWATDIKTNAIKIKPSGKLGSETKIRCIVKDAKNNIVISNETNIIVSTSPNVNFQ